MQVLSICSVKGITKERACIIQYTEQGCKSLLIQYVYVIVEV